MIRTNLIFIWLFFLSSSLAAQSFFSKKVVGQVIGENNDVEAVTVLNRTTKRGTITDANGFFKITVKQNDTLVFSAVQFQRKEIVITQKILAGSVLKVVLNASLTELDEVIVRPYNLSGDITKDLEVIPIDAVVTSSTLGLPNAYVKPKTKAERELYAATANPIMSFDPLINALSGRTKMLKKRVARNKLYSRTEQVKAFYADSLFKNQLKISDDRIDDLLYFCEVDTLFQQMVDSKDKLMLWEYLRKKSAIYRKNNGLE